MVLAGFCSWLTTAKTIAISLSKKAILNLVQGGVLTILVLTGSAAISNLVKHYFMYQKQKAFSKALFYFFDSINNRFAL